VSSDTIMTGDDGVRYSYENLKTQGWLEGHESGLDAAVGFLRERATRLFASRQDDEAIRTRDLADELIGELLEGMRRRATEHARDYPVVVGGAAEDRLRDGAKTAGAELDVESDKEAEEDRAIAPEVSRSGIRDRMNDSERSAWRVLLRLGARLTEIAGKPALDMSPIRVTSRNKLRLLVGACVEVAGRSGCNRRHMDRAGAPVYVVTDDPRPRKAV